MSALVIRIALPPSRKDIEAVLHKARLAAAVEAVAIIKRRTAAGVDARGKPFPAYTPEYAKAKGASGRKSSPPDLTASGAMLGALRVLPGAKPRIGWQGSRPAVRFARKGKKGGTTLKRGPGSVTHDSVVRGLSRKFRFFGIESKDDLARLNAAAQRAIDSEMRKLNATRRR